VSDQPKYRNAIISVSASVEARELLGVLKSIEVDFGRISAVKNAARILDLDLIAYEQEIIDEPDLAVPHPRMHLREFVLAPLCEIEPQWVHPVLGRTACDLFHSLTGKVSRETQAVHIC
jgi:2-amino-4-hydroxy-6-hydroxymethyldihydropteridine diphosphokinase